MAPPHVIACSIFKATAIAMMVGLTKEVGSHGLRVNAVCPSSVESPIWDRAKPVLSANPRDTRGPARRQDCSEAGSSSGPRACEEVAKVVSWLVSEATSLVTGPAISVRGGRVFPTV
jgi:NAD(P)-dependent dehydrogenase (short-subunit alcohol dehydrogenase family)